MRALAKRIELQNWHACYLGKQLLSQLKTTYSLHDNVITNTVAVFIRGNHDVVKYARALLTLKQIRSVSLLVYMFCHSTAHKRPSFTLHSQCLLLPSCKQWRRKCWVQLSWVLMQQLSPRYLFLLKDISVLSFSIMTVLECCRYNRKFRDKFCLRNGGRR